MRALPERNQRDQTITSTIAFVRRHTTTNAANNRHHHNRSWWTPTALTQQTFPQIRVFTSAC